jgi:dTDP-4-dehydrorhamnose reductase
VSPVLVWGRHGLLAQALRRNFIREWPILFWGKSDLPATNSQQVRKVCRTAPSAIINASGFTNLRRAEQNSPEATFLHVEIPRNLARLSRDLGVPFVTISSDYVFSGKEKRGWNELDPTEPVNVYGKTKLAGERAVLAAYPRAKIIRTAGLFGPASIGCKVSFPERIFHQVRSGSIPEVRSDLITSICHVDDLAQDLWAILWGSPAGIFHVAHQGGATWLQIAEFALQAAGLPSSLKPSENPDLPRPPLSILTSLWPETRGGHAGRKSWQEALREFMRTLRDG